MTHVATTKSGSLIFAEPPSISRPERQTYRTESRDYAGVLLIEVGLELWEVKRIIKREKIEWQKEGVVL